MAKGAAWMVGFKMLERSIGLVSTIILARLLEPGDFGLVAMATAFLGLLTLLTSFSFDVALIQKQDADRHLYDTAWTFNVIFGVLLALVLVATAIPLAQFYNEVRLEQILYVLAISTLLGGFGNIGPVAFRKDLQFHKEFYFLLAKKLMGFTVCMILAFTLRNYWALVWGTFAGRILEVLLSYRVHPYRPRFCLKGRKELFGFSGWLFLVNTIGFMCNRAPEFIIGKLVGTQALGLYNISNEIASLPTNELVQPINRVTFPAYSKLIDDDIGLANIFLKVQSIITLLALPIGTGIVLTAHLFVPILLGNKWLDTIPLIQLFSVYGTLMAVQSNASTVYLAKGKPKIQAFLAGFYMFMLLPIMFVLTGKNGIIGAVSSVLIALTIVTPISIWLSHRLLHLGFITLLGYLWRPVLATFSMAAVVFWLDTRLDLVPRLQLITIIIVGIIIYTLTILGLWMISGRKDGAESFIVNFLQTKLFKLPPKAYQNVKSNYKN
nr:lipopolysaccharide biosynthesis protein [Crenothrix polyspora]